MQHYLPGHNFIDVLTCGMLCNSSIKMIWIEAINTETELQDIQ
jgi:hypothetical protein